MKNKIYKDTARGVIPLAVVHSEFKKLSFLPHGNPEQEDCEEYRQDRMDKE